MSVLRRVGNDLENRSCRAAGLGVCANQDICVENDSHERLCRT